jgi:hypothetical protein
MMALTTTTPGKPSRKPTRFDRASMISAGPSPRQSRPPMAWHARSPEAEHEGALGLSHAAAQQPVTVFHAHTGRPGEGIDRGDGRDPYGRITGRGGGGHGRQREAEGIEKYKQANEGRWVTTEQRKATVEGAPNGRFYDGLAKKPDGTYEGIEVKSGTAGLTKPQESFDGKVGYNNPGYVTITNDQGEVETVQVTSTRVETVPAE